MNDPIIIIFKKESPSFKKFGDAFHAEFIKKDILKKTVISISKQEDEIEFQEMEVLTIKTFTGHTFVIPVNDVDKLLPR